MRMTTTPQQVQIHPIVSLEEASALVQQGKIPLEYAGVVASATSMQMQVATLPDGRRAIVCSVQVLLDPDTVALNVSPVFDARGEAMVPEAVRTAFALPPMVRIVLRRSILGPGIRAQIDRAPVDLSLEGDPC